MLYVIKGQKVNFIPLLSIHSKSGLKIRCTYAFAHSRCLIFSSLNLKSNPHCYLPRINRAMIYSTALQEVWTGMHCLACKQTSGDIVWLSDHQRCSHSSGRGVQWTGSVPFPGEGNQWIWCVPKSCLISMSMWYCVFSWLWICHIQVINMPEIIQCRCRDFLEKFPVGFLNSRLFLNYTLNSLRYNLKVLYAPYSKTQQHCLWVIR